MRSLILSLPPHPPYRRRASDSCGVDANRCREAGCRRTATMSTEDGGGHVLSRHRAQAPVSQSGIGDPFGSLPVFANAGPPSTARTLQVVEPYLEEHLFME